MTNKQINRLAKKCERYAALLGEHLAAIVESDTGVLTTRMSERERSIALRYREVVRQLASC